MKPFSLLIKPASGLCNIDCAYCFYKRVLDEVYVDRQNSLKMSLETAENMIRKFLSTKFPAVSICFQGGEPLLMGLDFYQKIIEFEKKWGFPGQSVGNSFQTNGLLITEDWADFFKQYNMLVGISLDGPPQVHDHYRKSYRGEGTFDRVMAAIEILRKKEVEFNILSMITSHSVTHIDETFSFFKQQGLNYLQFIPCLENDPKTGKISEHSINSDQYGTFLKRLFDLWYMNGYPDISVRLFDNILAYQLDGQHHSCCYQTSCTSYFLVEHNGDVFPCDFYAYEDWRLGNINTDSFGDLVKSKKRAEFSGMKQKVNPACRECSYFSFCHGDCTKFKVFEDRSPDSLSFLCPGFKDFLAYTEKRFDKVADQVRTQRRQNGEVPSGSQANIPKDFPRNEPCPCGSGKKFKKCHGKNA